MRTEGDKLSRRAASLVLSFALVGGFLLPAAAISSAETAADPTVFPAPGTSTVAPALSETPTPQSTSEPTASPTSPAALTPTPEAQATESATTALTPSATAPGLVTPEFTATDDPAPTATPFSTGTSTEEAAQTETAVTPGTDTPEPTGTPGDTVAAPTGELASPSPAPPTETATETSTPSATPSPTATPAILMGLPPPPPQAAGVRPAVSTSLVLSQLYGGGGNAGAPYTNDFIEIFNLGGSPASVGGWSVQYASAAGGAWAVTLLPSRIIPPGGYLLIQQASGGASGVPLPSPDVVGTIAMSASAGKVALVSDSTALSGACPVGPSIVDLVGYGATASCAEGSPTANLSNSTAALRSGGGAVDTDNNAVDFTVGPPNPRSSAFVTPTPSAALLVVINEVAWGGTAASAADEWIELHNPNAFALDLTGWTLASTTDGSPAISLAGVIPAGGYFLLERTDDLTVSDITADLIYVGDLGNAGETLALRDPVGNLVDTANADGGGWPAGSGSPAFYAMERTTSTLPDSDTNWHANNGVTRSGLDANGTPLNGTPRQANSVPLPAPTLTPTLTPTPTPTAGAYPALAVVINEVAWAGTAASSSDEWVELLNPGPSPISLAGWTLSDGGDVNISFSALVIGAGSYLLLERTDDATVSGIAADLIYTGGLSNGGEALVLRDALGNVIDTANGDGGAWPGGSDATYASMERRSPGPDVDGNWQSNDGYTVNGFDANGDPLRATPRSANSSNFPTPVPTPLPAGVLLNEFLPHPGSGAQEFVELINLGSGAVDLSGWQLDDAAGGSSPYTIPGGTVIQPFGLLAFFKDSTGLFLNDDGDTARLLAPGGFVVDEWSYPGDPGTDVSWARIPDGGAWNGRGIPTPGQSNRAAPEPPAPMAVPLATYRQWPDGAWATITGRVTVPAPLFGRRLILIQDDTGGLVVHLGRGDWPDLVPGQSVTLLGYLRHRTGRQEVYLRNRALVSFGPAEEAVPITPAAMASGQIDADIGHRLVRLVGRVMRLEAQAFWLDDGSGAVRVFFPASTGVRRPAMRRGEVWAATGVVMEMSATRTRPAGWQVQPRYAADVEPLTRPGASASPTELAPPAETLVAPTEEPTATAMP